MAKSFCIKTDNMQVHDVTVFTNLRFGHLHGDDYDSIFKYVHFETLFEEFAFSGHQNVM